MVKVSVNFTWPYHCQSVVIAGSFTNWVLLPIETLFELDPGYHEYKFYVDGSWCYDVCMPNVPNNFGSRNNIIRTTEKIKIIHISDTHSQYPIITEYADILIHTGDFSIGGHPGEYDVFNNWLNDLKIPHKIVILGNHDLDYFKDDGTIGKKLLTNAQVLNTELVVIENIKIFGVQWHIFNTWNFMSQSDYQNNHNGGWNKIPDNMDIVLTHQPPHGILDDDTHHWGSYDTLMAIKKTKPAYHLFGHIHQAFGNREVNIDGKIIKFYNSALQDEFSHGLVNTRQVIYF